jgi:hypothetical protein
MQLVKRTACGIFLPLISSSIYGNGNAVRCWCGNVCRAQRQINGTHNQSRQRTAHAPEACYIVLSPHSTATTMITETMIDEKTRPDQTRSRFLANNLRRAKKLLQSKAIMHSASLMLRYESLPRHDHVDLCVPFPVVIRRGVKSQVKLHRRSSCVCSVCDKSSRIGSK